MSVGHGTPGLRDFLRPFADLVDDVDADRRPILEFFPGVELTAAKWAPYSGSAYGYAGQIQYTLDGALRDIVAVDTDLGPLTRVESLADVVATAGSFFSQVGTAAVIPFWDDGVSLWDGGQTFDQTGALDLYVHLPGGVDASAHTIVPLLGFYFGARNEVHPRLGPDKLTNGGFESLTGWTETVSGAGWSSALDSVVFTEDTSSLKLVSTGAATGNVSRHQDLSTATAKMYRLAFAYRTDGLFSANLTARLLVSNTAGTLVLYSDGRDADASGALTLKPTAGEWRRGFFDFLAPDTTTRVRLQLYGPTSVGAGQLNFDAVELRRIYSFNYYDPRLATDSIPETEVASQGIFFRGKTVGLGAFSLMNTDAALDDVLPALLCENRPATVYVGGEFPDGQEVYRDDWRAGFQARTQRMTATDLSVTFECEDARNLVHVTLPPRDHSSITDPDMDPTVDGSPRRLVFATNQGTATSPNPATYPILWKPHRINRSATTGYGTYEVADTDGSLAGLHNSDPIVVVYPSEELAAKDLAGYPLYAADGLWSYDRATGALTILDDVRNFKQKPDGTVLSPTVLAFFFNSGGGGATAGILTGDGHSSATQIATSLQVAMRAAAFAAGNEVVTYSHTTHKFTIGRTSGTITLETTGSGNAFVAESYAALGFTTDSDHTGSTSYTAENAVFTDCDRDHIIRISAAGLRDDSTGSITGSANGAVYKHPDVARYLLTTFLGVPTTAINSTEFAAGRALDTGGVRVVLEEKLSSGEVLSRLELGALADLVIDGEGMWRWIPYQAGATPVREFFDRDYLTFDLSRDPQNVFKAARLRYGRNPSLDAPIVLEDVGDAGAATKYGRNDVLEVESFVDGDSTSYATTLADRLARLAVARPWIATFQARGKMVDLLVGRIIRLNRTRATYTGGTLSGVDFRVVALAHNFITGISRCVAVEDVDFTS